MARGLRLPGRARLIFKLISPTGVMCKSRWQAQTVQDVINAINTAGGASVTASLATTGNGIVITDNTTGGSTLRPHELNFSTAAADLGLSGAASGNRSAAQMRIPSNPTASSPTSRHS